MDLIGLILYKLKGGVFFFLLFFLITFDEHESVFKAGCKNN